MPRKNKMPQKKVNIRYSINVKNPLTSEDILLIEDALEHGALMQGLLNDTPVIKDNIVSVSVYHNKKSEFIKKMCLGIQSEANDSLPITDTSIIFELVDFQEEPTSKTLTNSVSLPGYRIETSNYREDGRIVVTFIKDTTPLTLTKMQL